MADAARTHHSITRRRVKRKFRPSELYPRDSNPLAPGQIPVGLNDPTGSIGKPGVTIWKFPTVPIQLHFDGGAIVTHARLAPLFWGDFWKTASNPSANDIHQAIASILQSPYLCEVMQYGFQSLSLDAGMIVTSPEPSFPTYSGSDVKDMVWDLIDDDRFPEPDDDGGRIIYMVFAPPGSNYEDAEAAGAHGEARDIDIFDVDYAWVGWCNHSTLDGITETFTHELVEILTDPEPYGGWTVQGFPELNNEIVDACFNQTGVVSDYRVSAYYSERLKACVVPAFPKQYGLSVSSTDEGIGPGNEVMGYTETTKHSICFSGGYDWTFFGQKRRVTLTAAAAGYIKPEFEWKVNGTPVFNLSALGVATLPITTAAATALDPLSMIATLPPQTVTAKVAAGSNVLILESTLGEPPGDYDITCSVSEQGLPNGYHTSRGDNRAVTVSGGFRLMDERFQTDLEHCMHLKAVLARKLIEEVVIPKIDEGDPPPVWTEYVRATPETEIEHRSQQAHFLAHAVEAVEPELAITLRQLANCLAAVAHAAQLKGIQRAE